MFLLIPWYIIGQKFQTINIVCVFSNPINIHISGKRVPEINKLDCEIITVHIYFQASTYILII